MATLLAHEWLAPHGGSENVFEQLVRAFPDAGRLCLWNDAPERFPEVRETVLARTPLRRSKAMALPFMPLAWSSVDLAGVDRMLVSSHAFAHQLATRAADRSIPAYAYVHSPARYVWDPELDPRGRGWVTERAARVLKPLDRRRTSTGVSYAANSQFVAQRIERCWGRQAQVIYPPVDVDRIQSGSWRADLSQADIELLESLPKDFVCAASRLVSYKRIDLSIEFAAVNDCPLVIAGDGPQRGELEELAKQARVPVRFLGRVSDAVLYSLYEKCLLFVFLAIEDFGIMPVEAMASGVPTVVSAVGGARESVERLNGGDMLGLRAGTDEIRQVFQSACAVSRGEELAHRARMFSDGAFRSRVLEWTSATN